MGNVSIYLPPDSKTQEIMKRVKMKQAAFEKEFGRKISFSELVIQGLANLVKVDGKK
jgi:hypothetical protein